jgi:hypothetical protein
MTGSTSHWFRSPQTEENDEEGQADNDHPPHQTFHETHLFGESQPTDRDHGETATLPSPSSFSPDPVDLWAIALLGSVSPGYVC